MQPDNPLRPLFRKVSEIKGIGPKSQPLIERVAGSLLRDVAFHLPFRFIERALVQDRAELINDAFVVISVDILSHNRRRSRTVVNCDSNIGPVSLVYFGMPGARLNSLLPEGQSRIISGKVAVDNGRVQFTHPDKVLKVGQIEELRLFEPVYELTQGLTQGVFARAVDGAFSVLPSLPEWVDQHLLAQRAWPTWQEALELAHGRVAPAKDRSLRARAVERLSFDELLSHQLTLAILRDARQAGRGVPIAPAGDMQAQLVKALPFELTSGQVKASEDIAQDMKQGQRMMRLLMGDVGTGKTVVAALAAARAVEAGYQVAIMGPTDILAQQLFDEMQHLLGPLGVRIEYLSGKLSNAQRRDAILSAAEGKAQVLCGTHALFQDSVSFRNLGLVVIDEQHRFGVEQRMRLAAKGAQGDLGPHMLLMSATPIPRTLVMAHYGDIATSQLRDRPKGRKPITTVTLELQNWGRVQDALGKAIARGDQAYWICPLVEESAVSDLAAAEDRYALLSKALGKEHVGLVHGKMPPAQKDETMEAFRSGKLAVLVATTVVEVGVNVPNASIMIIEQAERFGLAQLHQLRGRVGRGEKQSSCTLLFKGPLGEISKRRLQVMKETQDGFRIAEEDLQIRGSGDVIGTRQAGLPQFKFADALRDAELLEIAASQARYLRQADPALQSTDQGQAARVLLQLFDRQQAFELIAS